MRATAASGSRGPLLGGKDVHGAVSAGWDACLWFLISVGYKVPWTAISSLLHQLTQQFGQPRVLLWLNLAYFLPSMPALLLHSSLQDWLEHRMGVHRAALLRFTVGLGGLAALCLAFPRYSSSLPSLLAVTAAVGVAYSIAFGTSHQLVPRFSQRCTVALTTGFVSCGVVVLLADLALKPHAANYTPAALNRLFQVAAAQTLVGLLSAALLLRRHWRRLAAANKQQQHHVIGVLGPAAGLGALGRAGSGGSSSRHLLLPRPNSWTTGHVAGAVGFRHVSQQQQQHSPGFEHAHAGTGTHSSSSAWGEAGSYSHHADSGAVVTGGGGGLSVHVMVGSDDGSTGSAPGGGGGGGPGSNTSSSGPLEQQHHHQPGSSSFRDARWDPPHKKRSNSNSSGKGSKGGGGLLQRLQPVLLLLQLAWRIWPAWVALLLSVGSSMLVFPLFTCVDTSGRLGERLPQVLFYARLLGDITGRMVPPAWQLSSSRSVLSAAFLKSKLLVVLVPGILSSSLVGGDLCLAGLVAANWFLSGYINTGAYLLAPRLATLEAPGLTGGGSGGSGGLGCCWPWRWVLRRRAAAPPLVPGKGHHHHRGSGSSSSQLAARQGGALGKLGPAALRSKAGAVMSFCFQTSCFLGLMAAWVLQEVLQESGHPAFAAAAAGGMGSALSAAAEAATSPGVATSPGAGAGFAGAYAAAAGLEELMPGGVGDAGSSSMSPPAATAAAAAIAAAAAVAAGSQHSA